MNDQAEKPKNGTGQLLTGLLSGNNASKLLALLIVITGGGNFLQTRSAETTSREEFERAFRDIQEIHGVLSVATERQKMITETLQRLEHKMNSNK